MKNPVLMRNLILVALMSIVASFSLKAQCLTPLPCPSPLTVAANPAPPTCKPPGGPPFKILVILDESGSIAAAGATGTVRNAVNGFASTLNALTASTGKIEMGIIEFSDGATNALAPATLIDVKAANFVSTVQTYTATNYNPSGGCTNFEAALTTAIAFPRVDMIFFITDGVPTKGNINPSVWSAKSDQLKAAGTYVFAIGVGADVCESHLKDLSGPRRYPDNDFKNADWTLANFATLGNALLDLAASIVDNKAPVITCPSPIVAANDPNQCGKKVNFVVTATDECLPVSVTSVPADGSFFNVGVTIVTSTARDNVGNTSTCTFKVTVLDLEAPKITCPANKLISCEESILPANTGSPVTSDNCGISGVTSADIRADGSCPNEFTLNRTWTAVDVNGNIKTCQQTISVEDKKSPVITCPANITVTCDTSVAKTGLATAVDNCDPTVSLSHRDIHISGDCEWFCITERHWTAVDDCRNTSKCVQVITKDVTPLIEQALASGPLVWGQPAATVKLPPGKGACVVQWLPYSGVVPTALKFDDAVAGADCKLMTNPLDATGHIVNPLLGEAMKLKILVRLKPSLGTTKLSTFPCTMHFIVKQALAPNPDVNELLRVTDLTLGNVNANLLTPAHTVFLLDVFKCINATLNICKL